MSTGVPTPPVAGSSSPSPSSPVTSLVRKANSSVVLVCLTVVVVATLGAYVWAQSTGHDGSPLLPVLVAILGSGIPGIAALGKVGEVGATVTNVQHQTNGNMTRLLDITSRALDASVQATAQAQQTAHAAVQNAGPDAHTPDTAGSAVPSPPPPTPGVV